MTDHRTQELEARLVRTLDQQADAVHDAPFTVHDIRGRARSIRRRRRGVAAAAAAAVAAVVLPVALLSGPGDERSDRTVDPATPPAAPGAAVLHDDVVTLPDGGTVAVPAGIEEVTELGVLTDGRVLLMLFRKVVVLAPDGTVESEHPVVLNDLTMGQGDRTAAWVDPDLGVRVLESGVAQPVAFAGVPMPGEGSGAVDAVLGSDCAAGGCEVLGGDYETTTSVIVSDRIVETRDLASPVPFRVTDVSADGSSWAVGLPPEDGDQFGCAGIYDVAAEEVVARTCDTSGLRFSPDGQHVLGVRGDNNMLGEVTVLDSDLQPVLTFEPEDAVVSRAAWGDAGHLLVSTTDLDGRAWSLVRVPVDGSAPEVADGSVAGENPEFAAEYQFSE